MALDVLITGANRGVGLEIARQMSQRGDRVVATARNPDAADELRSLDVRVEPLDVTNADQVGGLAAALEPGALDVLVNNAGVGVRGRPLGDLDFDKMLRFFDTNAVGAMRVTEALLPHLRRGKARKVMHLTSRMGSISDNTSGGSYAYRASKGGAQYAQSQPVGRSGPKRASYAPFCTPDGCKRTWEGRPLRRRFARARPGLFA